MAISETTAKSRVLVNELETLERSIEPMRWEHTTRVQKVVKMEKEFLQWKFQKQSAVEKLMQSGKYEDEMIDELNASENKYARKLADAKQRKEEARKEIEIVLKEIRKLKKEINRLRSQRLKKYSCQLKKQFRAMSNCLTLSELKNQLLKPARESRSLGSSAP